MKPTVADLLRVLGIAEGQDLQREDGTPMTDVERAEVVVRLLPIVWRRDDPSAGIFSAIVAERDRLRAEVEKQ